MISIVLCLLVVFLCAKPLGSYIARVYGGGDFPLARWLAPLERLAYRAMGVDPAREMRWTEYAVSLLVFSAAGFALLYALLLSQGVLPLNPGGMAGLSPDLAFNVAMSFVTNTDWQSYSGEVALSHFSQVVGITLQQFLSSAAGMAVAAALFRGVARSGTDKIGNFWADLLRGLLYILLPLSFLLALLLGAQGVVQTFEPYADYESLEMSEIGGQGAGSAASPDSRPLTSDPLRIALGPVASLAAIKQLGTNGGGFFGANAAHPLENPTPLSNFFQAVAILLLPVAFVYAFGATVGDTRQGWAVLAAMTLLFLPLLLLCVLSERGANPLLAPLGVDSRPSALSPGGNMEGKELRFGPAESAFWAAATTAASNGSVNAMHDSFLPLGGLAPLLLMQFGEVIYGGVGSGMYGMMAYVLLSVFIAGLMVGRTPEYLGKKIGVFEVKMASLTILIPAMALLIGCAVAGLTEAGRAAALNPGAQGFSEILYAFASAANNNGSAFAGLSAASPFYNLSLGVVMWIGRFSVMIPMLAIAGAMASRQRVPMTAGTLPTHTPMFIVILGTVVLLYGVLTYVPALALGPVAEHLHLHAQAGAAYGQ